MLTPQWKHLKSGTDIRGTAVHDNPQKIELTSEVVFRIAAAFGCWLKTAGTTAPRVAVGHDSRISAPRMKAAVIGGLQQAGCAVFDCGYASTPAMFMATVEEPLCCDGSVQITASHHPYDKNGLKFFTKQGGLEGYQIEEILELAQADNHPYCESNIPAQPVDFMSVYTKILRDMICHEVNAPDYGHPLKGLKIIVDAGNGVGGFYAADILEPLGADCTGSQFLEPDGMFPNHIPNPENPDAMASATKATVAAGADLGIIFDTDVDRMGCVDENGEEINRNRLIALAAVIALEHAPGGTIVTDSLTSDGLRAFIEQKLGAKQLRYQRGYKNVINKAIALNQAGTLSPLAIETSGHAALKDNYFLDDGAYLATKIVIKMAQLKKQEKSLHTLIGSLEEPQESLEFRFMIQLEDFRPYGEGVLEDLKAFAAGQDGWVLEPENYEGIRINFTGGWFLLRLSVHDPILPLNIETEEKGIAHQVLSALRNFFQSYAALDKSQLEAYFN